MCVLISASEQIVYLFLSFQLVNVILKCVCQSVYVEYGRNEIIFFFSFVCLYREQTLYAALVDNNWEPLKQSQM